MAWGPPPSVRWRGCDGPGSGTRRCDVRSARRGVTPDNRVSLCDQSIGRDTGGASPVCWDPVKTTSQAVPEGARVPTYWSSATSPFRNKKKSPGRLIPCGSVGRRGAGNNSSGARRKRHLGPGGRVGAPAVLDRQGECQGRGGGEQPEQAGAAGHGAALRRKGAFRRRLSPGRGRRAREKVGGRAGRPGRCTSGLTSPTST
jgi:hypothetical protein